LRESAYSATVSIGFTFVANVLFCRQCIASLSLSWRFFVDTLADCR
jgi:hypothetical protein